MDRYIQKWPIKILMILSLSISRIATNAQTDTIQNDFELLPVVSYDNDTGFGYGLKIFTLGIMDKKESFDLLLFTSTKGERWCRFVFSIPDIEMRQGSKYPFALDFTIDYDKWIKNNYFKTGNSSLITDKETYTREPLEIGVIASRGFTSSTVLQSGFKYRYIRNSNYQTYTKLGFINSLSLYTVETVSLFLSYRYDTRNSVINPANGLVAELESDYALAGNTKYFKALLSLRKYVEIISPGVVLASRIAIEDNFIKTIPVQLLSSLGGNKNLRGYTQDRFLDYTSGIYNIELRFPIIWKFIGIAGIDAGRVWPALNKISFNNWKFNYVSGIRFLMENFVVRFDAGFSKEGASIYFNFGHPF